MGLSSNEYYHPLFAVPKKKLLNLTKDWAARRLSPTEEYLLYLALLHSTELIIWRSQARYTEKTPKIIASNMEALVQMIGKIDIIRHPAFVLPKMTITYDTGDLATSFYWVQAWMHNYKEFMEDFIDARTREEVKVRVERREYSLARLIKDQNVIPEKLANNIAEWAEDACEFPVYEINHPLQKGKRVPINEFWKEMIRACVKEEQIWRYSEGQFDKLIEHVEENLQNESMGSIYSHALMKLLRGGLEKREAYTGFGDIDLAGKTTQFRLMGSETSAEDANLIAAIQSAPLTEPKKENYPTLGAFIRAKLNFDAARRLGGGLK